MSKTPRPKGVDLPPIGPIQWVRSAIFLINIYVMMAVLGLIFLPYAVVSIHGARTACKTYSRYVFWCAKWMVGIRTEVRGPVPKGEILVAAKHQSFLDIMMIFEAAPSARFIMKREILWTPVIGAYAKRIRSVPVERGRGAVAMAKMISDVAAQSDEPGQLIIYPQGTRVAPGAEAPYKAGVGALYQETGQKVVPVATNVGAFWPRTGIGRRPGTAIVEFLPTIPQGLERQDFMATLEATVETASDRLLQETGLV